MLAEQLAPRTVNKILSALRGVLRQAWKLGQMSTDDYQRASDLRDITHDSPTSGRALDRDEISKIFGYLGRDGVVAARDAALMALLLSGLRAAEVSTLRLEDIRPGEEEILVRGKGRKQRLVPLDLGACLALRAWLRARGAGGRAVLCPIHATGEVQVERHLTTAGMRYICDRIAEAMKLRPFTPHDLRRTCATFMDAEKVTLDTIRLYLGHSYTQTTQTYLRGEEERKRRAAATLSIPYEGAISGG
jgi:integrase